MKSNAQHAQHALIINCQLCVLTIAEVSTTIFWCGCCSLWTFVAKKATKGTELQFLCTQGTLQGGKVEDHRMMFTNHLHLPQSYIQAILYICKADYMMPSIQGTHFICSSNLLGTIVKIVRKANKQMNRRQCNEGNFKLYHMIEKGHRIPKKGNLNFAS